MTQSPTTVTYSLEEVLGQIVQKLDHLDNKVEALSKKMDTKFEILRKDAVKLFLPSFSG